MEDWGLDILMEDLENKCTWRIMAEDPTSTTFQDVHEGHPLYPCFDCGGEVGACPNHSKHRELLQLYGVDERKYKNI